MLLMQSKTSPPGMLPQLHGIYWRNGYSLKADIKLTSKKKVVFESLKAGNNAIKAMKGEINLEYVQKLLDGTDEAKAYQDDCAFWNLYKSNRDSCSVVVRTSAGIVYLLASLLEPFMQSFSRKASGVTAIVVKNLKDAGLCTAESVAPRL